MTKTIVNMMEMIAIIMMIIRMMTVIAMMVTHCYHADHM